jgi:hypothetical protein
MKILNQEEAKRLVTNESPSIRYDITRDPWFPKSRTDVAVVQRDAEDGCSYGRTVWYVAYDNGKGTKIKRLHDTGTTHDNCHTWSVNVVAGFLVVKTSKGEFRKELSKLGLPN